MSKRGQKFRLKSSELINHMVSVGRALISQRLGVDETVATELARDYAHELATHFGGQLFYFPKDLAFTLSSRDRKIYEAFNGTNHEDLARQHGLGIQQIYKILEQVRREEVARRQGRLFEVDDASDQPQTR